MSNDKYDDERIQQLANAWATASNAYDAGVRISDDMTFEEAKLLNFGRKLSEIVGRRKGCSRQNVVEAAGRFGRKPK